jgi:hypothetical protein
MRKTGRALQTSRNSLFRGTFDPFGVFPIKFCMNCVGALKVKVPSQLLKLF